MPAQKLLPGSLPVSLGCRFPTVLLKHSSDGAPRNLMTQIGHRSLYSPVPPIPVLCGHAEDQLPDLILRSGTPRALLLAAITFDADQFAVPSQERLWRNDSGQFVKQSPAQLLGPDGYAATLVVIQA